MSNPVVSLCIPTNGIIKWLIPVLESIYAQNVDEKLYEVVVTDNGRNLKFKNAINKYISTKTNFVYKKTSAEGFLNQIESFKITRGLFLKFINHRMVLLPGALQAFIDFALENMENKPVVYFSNGKLLNLRKEITVNNSFDKFVCTLSYWSSWSAGIALWKEDLALLDKIKFNNLFPHTDILFLRRDHEEYIVDNRILLHEIPTNWAFKGSYDLFNAFAVEYISIILNLFRDGNISKKTFLKVKRDNFSYISDRYIVYIFLKKKSSFDFTGYTDSINFFYSIFHVRVSVLRLPLLALQILIRRIKSKRIRKLQIAGE
ncbi:hypothetical protein EXM22_02815 [Oceanispirochaeta crateris]|uniref:Glycosyltransferase n=1 Tax=Oceanispirochaeta crateris TaxID=2518645 RepID=A0A5C1QIJ7_9SPIO|nr:hypothetical protein [Oceanispirochaeta crateris]QEN06969.1 hypothetical protein EXM22_02815 [Oceanispirochaeta crateris]